MLKSTDIYRLEKLVWTEEDFGHMGWHDVKVHGITFESEKRELILDLDYIFAWVEPEPPSPGYTFWISPATLVFKNTWNFNADLGDPLGVTIMGIERSEPRTPTFSKELQEWTWKMDLLQGEISFDATGFSQYTRKAPVRCRDQQFSVEERGGISFVRAGEMIE